MATNSTSPGSPAYFPPASKAKMMALVSNVRTALAARIQRVSWMSDATKAKALEKLSKLSLAR